MNRTDVERISAAGRAKLDALSKYPVRYVSRAAMAGAFVMVGTLLSIACAAWFYDAQLGVSKVLGMKLLNTANSNEIIGEMIFFPQ